MDDLPFPSHTAANIQRHADMSHHRANAFEPALSSGVWEGLSYRQGCEGIDETRWTQTSLVFTDIRKGGRLTPRGEAPAWGREEPGSAIFRLCGKGISHWRGRQIHFALRGFVEPGGGGGGDQQLLRITLIKRHNGSFHNIVQYGGKAPHTPRVRRIEGGERGAVALPRRLPLYVSPSRELAGLAHEVFFFPDMETQRIRDAETTRRQRRRISAFEKRERARVGKKSIVGSVQIVLSPMIGPFADRRRMLAASLLARSSSVIFKNFDGTGMSKNDFSCTPKPCGADKIELPGSGLVLAVSQLSSLHGRSRF